jgi:hypothetical protein
MHFATQVMKPIPGGYCLKGKTSGPAFLASNLVNVPDEWFKLLSLLLFSDNKMKDVNIVMLSVVIPNAIVPIITQSVVWL